MYHIVTHDTPNKNRAMEVFPNKAAWDRAKARSDRDPLTMNEVWSVLEYLDFLRDDQNDPSE